MAACARMVLAFHGLALPEADLRQLLETKASGTVARNLLRVASLGYDVRVVASNLAQLRDAINAGQPPIVFVDTGQLDYWQSGCSHVAVVVGIDDATVWLNDPFFDSSPQHTSLGSFLRAWGANAQYAAFIRPKT
jgi:ABC-type bacteriocin/lantibiotic exporter with double-glycine peptidase domain